MTFVPLLMKYDSFNDFLFTLPSGGRSGFAQGWLVELGFHGLYVVCFLQESTSVSFSIFQSSVRETGQLNF